mgnify:CR=1 FL=1
MNVVLFIIAVVCLGGALFALSHISDSRHWEDGKHFW